MLRLIHLNKFYKETSIIMEEKRSKSSITIQPRSRKAACSFNYVDLSTKARNIYYNTLVLKIKLPQFDCYPLHELSSAKTDFVKAAENYPKLSEEFYKLDKIQKVNFTSPAKSKYKFFKFIDSMCVISNSSGVYCSLLLLYHKSNLKELKVFLESLGVDSSVL